MRPSRREVLELLVRLRSDCATAEDCFTLAKEQWPWVTLGVVRARLKQSVRTGDLEVFDHPEAGVALILTPLGAERLKVMLSETSEQWWYKWGAYRNMAHWDPHEAEDDSEEWEAIAYARCRAPGPLARVMALEAGEWLLNPAQCVKFRADQGWSWRWKREQPDPRNCPYHGKLRTVEYCLFCDKWGYEHKLEPVRPIEVHRVR